MTATLNKIAESAEDTSTTELTKQLESLRNDLSALTSKISDLGLGKSEEAVSAVKSKAKSKAADARGALADQAETARLHAMELQDKAEGFVKNQPATALGIAAGLGFLVGFLGARK